MLHAFSVYSEAGFLGFFVVVTKFVFSLGPAWRGVPEMLLLFWTPFGSPVGTKIVFFGVWKRSRFLLIFCSRTDFPTFTNVSKGKDNDIYLYIYFIREGTDLGTNVFVSLFPDGHSNYKIDLGAHESCDRVSY